MRYICERDHIFEHVGKMILTNEHGTITEIPICPICESNIYSEYVLDKKSIKSVISVDLADVEPEV